MTAALKGPSTAIQLLDQASPLTLISSPPLAELQIDTGRNPAPTEGRGDSSRVVHPELHKFKLEKQARCAIHSLYNVPCV